MSAAAQEDWVARGALAWEMGMRAAQPLIRQRAEAQRAVAKANREAGAKRPCAVKDCKRHAYKHRLCRAHWALVPWEERTGLLLACIEAQMKAARRFDARFVRLANERARAQLAQTSAG